MIKEVKIPSPGESINEVEIAEWLVSDGDIVKIDQELAEIESEKATLSLTAEDSGKISIKIKANEIVKVGETACTIDNSYSPEDTDDEEEPKSEGNNDSVPEKEEKDDIKSDEPKEESKTKKTNAEKSEKNENRKSNDVKLSPLARRMMDENGLSIDDVLKGLGRITKADVEQVLQTSGNEEHEEREEKREKMSALRKKLSERLVEVKNETAMLTTFNEVDMSIIMKIRSDNKQAFIEKYGIKPGFMSFFTKAAALALKDFPNVNAYIDGEEIVYHNYSDVGIAVQTPKGLMVPVLKDADKKDIPGLEKEIKELADKARNKKISVDELKGGTFSITNGGVFGSLLSTPLINPPQAAILGMHAIQDRPVAVNGKVEVKPMMYLALSYDHRIIDGKDSVSFLKMIKEILEEPGRFLTGGKSGDKALLNL